MIVKYLYLRDVDGPDKQFTSSHISFTDKHACSFLISQHELMSLQLFFPDSNLIIEVRTLFWKSEERPGNIEIITENNLQILIEKFPFCQ